MRGFAGIVLARFVLIFLILFMTFLLDAGIEYFFDNNYISILFGISLRSVAIIAWWALIFTSFNFLSQIFFGASLFKILTASDIVFSTSLIVLVFYVYYLAGGATAVSVADDQGIIFEKGEFTLLGLHKIMSNILVYTFSILSIHLLFFLHALTITQNLPSSETEE